MKCYNTKCSENSEFCSMVVCNRKILEKPQEKSGKKFDTDKLRLELLPIRPLEKIAKILTFGAKKYGDRNWEEGLKWSRVFGALLRHLFAWWRGEDTDEESGESHLAHAGCCILFLLEYEETKRNLDDRPKETITINCSCCGGYIVGFPSEIDGEIVLCSQECSKKYKEENKKS